MKLNRGIFNLLWLGIFPGLLFACGTETGKTGPPTTTPPISYTAFEAQSNTLHNIWDGVAFTDPATIPAGGSANYSGVMRLTVETGAGELRMNGAMQLITDFASNSLSGNVQQFIDQNDSPLTGTLLITGGVLDRLANTGVDYTYSAKLGGTLSGSTENFNISGDLSGDFHGSNYLATGGIIAGTAISSFGTGYLFGDFIAEQ